MVETHSAAPECACCARHSGCGRGRPRACRPGRGPPTRTRARGAHSSSTWRRNAWPRWCCRPPSAGEQRRTGSKRRAGAAASTTLIWRTAPDGRRMPRLDGPLLGYHRTAVERRRGLLNSAVHGPVAATRSHAGRRLPAWGLDGPRGKAVWSAPLLRNHSRPALAPLRRALWRGRRSGEQRW